MKVESRKLKVESLDQKVDTNGGLVSGWSFHVMTHTLPAQGKAKHHSRTTFLRQFETHLGNLLINPKMTATQTPISMF